MDTASSASYLDLHFEFDNDGLLRTKLYDKRDDLNFPIVNFPFICRNIPTAPTYEYTCICLSWSDIPEVEVPIMISLIDRGLLLTRKLLNQRFLVVKLKSSIRKFYGHRHDLVKRYRVSVSQVTTDMFPFA